MSVFFRRRGDAPNGTDFKTWFLNETIVNGNLEVNVGFTSNNSVYVSFTVTNTFGDKFDVYYDDYRVYRTSSGGWNNQAYRTVVFDTVPTGTLRTWLEANATPI